MNSQPQFQRVHRTVGTFVLLMVLAVIAAVIVTGHSQRWFARMGRVVVRFPQEGTEGIKEGADVMMLGTAVGSIEKLTPGTGYDDPMTAVLKIQEGFMPYIRLNSHVYIRKTFGIGDAYVEIKKGSRTSPEYGHNSSPLIVIPEQDTQQMIEEAVKQLQKEAIPAVHQLGLAISELNVIEGHVDQVAQNIEHGDGPVGRLINDPQMGHDLAQTLPKVNQSLDSVRLLTDDARRTTSALPAIVNTLQEQAKTLPDLVHTTQVTIAQLQPIMADLQKSATALPATTKALQMTMESLPGMVIQTQETLRQIQRLVEAAQKTWLLRSYVDQQNQGRRVSPPQIGAAQ